MLKNTYKILTLGVLVTLGACTAGVDDTGLEYAPQMYHSTPYEPLSQIQDENSGSWLDSNPEDEHGEFYNSNPYNAHNMTMREPVANTIKRGEYIADYGIDATDYASAEALLTNPFADSDVALKEGKALYLRFCEHCHGEKGAGDGLVGEVYKGVTAYNSATVKDKKAGHIYWVITNGKGRMGAHASQLSVDERWKIVTYVQTLQKQ
ncbi:c-type cytochrome [Marinoscillum furvescens]|uniref:Quinol:cytochrome c oxidoreductase monoheme cytochrome subunit n=1 Tax=Marinoscillum furvescens DSM 4134 TaxID=1122208 RepID=A0A3D9L005_MARFU|nr:cytochrome c [Marinoscillum furvescens]RED96230.1 quinol:cytochrome c oxidoreductase monoheme cytochrome subunit [Marinoscillum furvescens DSM 4134]